MDSPATADVVRTPRASATEMRASALKARCSAARRNSPSSDRKIIFALRFRR
jgi:hypothetical protein